MAVEASLCRARAWSGRGFSLVVELEDRGVSLEELLLGKGDE